MIFKLYIENSDGEYVNVPTFKDESVNYKAKISDAEDLDGVYNNTTNNFSIPATDVSNDLFKYWFESGYMGDDYFDIKEDLNAFIELNTIPYRIGKVKLLGADTVNGRPTTYRLSFSGNLISLDKKFGEDKLSSLDMSIGDFSYTPSNIANLMTSPSDFVNASGSPIGNLLVIPPMFITSENLGYDSDGNTAVDLIDRGVADTSIRPSVRVSAVLRAIEAKYGITFNQDRFGGDIFKTSTFNNLYLWLNGKEASQIHNWGTLKATSYTDTSGEDIYTNIPTPVLNQAFEVLPDGTIKLRMNYDIMSYNPLPPAFFGMGLWARGVSLTVTNPSGSQYRIRIVDKETGDVISMSDWTYSTTQTYSNVGVERIDANASRDSFEEMERSYAFEIIKRGAGLMSFRINAISKIVQMDKFIINKTSNQQVVPAFTDNFIVADNMPDMTVTDFFKGLMKAYKLVIRPVSEDNFIVQTLDNYYDKGNTIDLTENLDVSKVDIKARESFGDIKFKWEESDLVMQKQFRDNIAEGRDYGNLNIKFDKLKGNKDIEIPFTNLLLTRLPTVSDFIFTAGLHQELDGNDLEESRDGVFLFYYNGQRSLPKNIKIHVMDTEISVNSIPDISNANLVRGRMLDSLSFTRENNPDPSSRILDVNLYSKYWRKWMITLYDRDARIVNYRGKLDYHTLNSLELNSKIIVGNNIYNIDDYDLNLTNYDFKVNLIPNIDHKISDSRVSEVINGTSFSYNNYQIVDTIYLGEYSDWSVIKGNTGDGTYWARVELQHYGNYFEIKDVDSISIEILKGSGFGSRTMDLDFVNMITQEVFTIKIVQHLTNNGNDY